MMIYKKLAAIQAELKVPKNQHNSFGNYNYRSCEDILEAVKEICAKHETVLLIADELVYIGDRYYVKAFAQLYDLTDSSCITSTAYAREEETKKGMDGSQITGASSSYARKYALNGLFCIDDTKDSDATNNGQTQQKPAPQYTQKKQSAPQPQQRQAQRPTGSLDQQSHMVCDVCGAPLADVVRDYSIKKYGRPLCMTCQKNEQVISNAR